MARRYAVTTASRAAGQKSQYWVNTQNGEVVHDATSTLDPGEVIVSAIPRADTSSSLLDHYSTCTHHSGPGSALLFPSVCALAGHLPAVHPRPTLAAPTARR
jgi:hypothetical protein